ncbi:MAG: aminoacetone oxidase family FAD-binding enzyme [Candidatus Cloacimonadota bacterium]|nr:MAG: aminoacetone oxidase family FAD-binding enzyme [Candidatus Cloacimonadota bacterium]
MAVKQFDVMVIGGGAAGLMAAGTAADNSKQVVLIEKNPVLGKKLLITGKGRCNLTNYCDVNDLIQNTPVNGRFMTNSFYRFSAYDTLAFFNDLGLETKIERGNRVFPKSDKAIDVVKKLIKYISQNKVEVIHSAVSNIQLFGKLFAAKLINGEVVRAENLIIATGGKSYPGTGSTGDGYKFARSFGHKVTKFKPSLVPIEAMEFLQPNGRSESSTMVEEKKQSRTITEDSKAKPSVRSVRVPALQGLAIKNAGITITDNNGKIIYEDFGELLFTHFGVSGPVILSASSHISKIKNNILHIDLKPALSEETLDKRLQKEFKENSNKNFQNILKHLLPSKMLPVFIILSQISAEKKAHQISRKERMRIIELMKDFSIKLDKLRPIKEAIITSGGVDVKEINPKTMESKIVPGLYFAGEIIDVDAYTGGFNLQIAWSTGFCAGQSCAEK